MSKINLIILLLVLSFNTLASLSQGIQLIASGNKAEGISLLERSFEDSSKIDKAKISLILSRVKDLKLQNPAIYYAKYALKFLSEYLSNDERSLLNIELADYYFSLGDVKVAKKYYQSAKLKCKNKEIIDYINYRLAWVSFNNEDYKMAKALIIKSLKSKNAKMTSDAIFLLGKVVTETETDLRNYLGLDILNNLAFIKGLKEGREYLNLKDMIGSYSKFFMSVNGKVKDECNVLKILDTLPQKLEIKDNAIKSYLNMCLVKHKALASHVSNIIIKNQLDKRFSETLALSYFMNDKKEESCKIYQKLFEKDVSHYKGLVLSCPLEKVDLGKLSNVKSTCLEGDLYTQVSKNVLKKISKLNNIPNQGLLYAGLVSNLEAASFDYNLKKLISCEHEKELLALRSLKDEKYLEKLELASIFNNNCELNTQNMLKATYLKYIKGQDKLSSKAINCIRQKLSKSSQYEILSSLDFNNYQGQCLFEFDCTINKLSNYVLKNKKIKNEKTKRSMMTFYWRLNLLQKTNNLVERKVTLNNLDSLYTNVTTIKKLFVKPAFYNSSLMLKASKDYNQLIEKLVFKIETLAGLEGSQIDMLKNALLKEKVML